MLSPPLCAFAAKAVLKADGRFISIVNRDEAGLDSAAHAPLTYATFYALKNNAAHQDELAQLIVDGKLQVKVESTFPFTKQGVTDAFKKMAGGKSVGKNVIVMREDFEAV